MIELLIGIALIVAMVKIASADNQSPMMWGVITFLVSAACIALIPLPVIRLGIAGVVVFIGMIGYKAATNS